MIGWGYLIGYGYLAVLLGIAELLSRRTDINREVMRKVLHCLIGLEWFALYYCFAETWQIVVIPATFILVNILSYRFKLFHSVEREQGNHPGTIYYAVAMTAMSIVTAIRPAWMFPFGVAVICLSFGDAAAALCGQYLRPRIAVFDKSLWGTVACFVFALLAQVALSAIVGMPIRMTNVVAIAAVCAVSEVLCTKGTDNLFVCLWCMVWAYTLYYSNAWLSTVLMLYVAFVLAVVGYRTAAFTGAAALVTGLLLSAIGLFGGWFAYLFILCSYAVIYLAEHFVRKSQFKERRKIVQIVENGLPAVLALVAYYVTKREWLLVVFAVAITQSLTDSFASCMGNAYGGTPVDILRHRPVEKGLSGGITWVGTLSGILVSVLSMVVIGLVFGWRWYLVAVALLPFGGMMLDSLLGASIQHKEICDVCGTVCECTAHCGRPTLHYRGLKHVSNGLVNLICNTATTLAACLVLYFIH